MQSSTNFLAAMPFQIRDVLREMFKGVVKLNVDTNPDSIRVEGDSPNEAPIFDFIANAVGTSNDIDFVDSLEAGSGWVTDNHTGTGFVELAATFLRARK